MARAKKKAAKKTRGKAQKTAQLPSGFDAIAGFAPSWQYGEEPLIVGKIVGFGEVEQTRKKGKKLETVEVRICTIEKKDGGGMVTVWESATLKPLFDDFAEGETVAIAYQGLGVAKAGQNAPKLFAIGRQHGATPRAKKASKKKASKKKR